MSTTFEQRRATAVASLRERIGGRAPLVVAAGLVLAFVGVNLAWATFAGFPGKMSLRGLFAGRIPGGARSYCLLLLPAFLLAFAPWAGRRRAGIVAAVGVLAIAAGNLIAIANDGGEINDVAAGAWLTVAGALVALAGFSSLPDDAAVRPWRMPVVAELLVIATVLGTVLFLVVMGLEIEESSRFVSFIAFVAIAAMVLQRLGAFESVAAMGERHRAITLAAAAIAAVAFPFTQDGSAYWLRVFASVGVFAAAAIGLNVVVGLAGLLDLGYIAFFGVGAYVGGLLGGAALSAVDIQLPFIFVIPIGATIAALFGLVIGAPTLRLRGDYLAIVTLGFGEIFRIVANNWDGLTRGPNGVAGIPDLELPGGFNFGDSHELLGIPLPGFANYYFAELVLLAVVMVASRRPTDSRVGRAWVAIREDETAASAMGINTVSLKLLAFAIGAFMAGAAGTVNSHLTTQVSPDSYTFLESVLLLAAVVLGGMGTIPGALLGASALFVIPEKLRAFQDKRLLLFGIALILMMRFRPEGIVPSKRRQREFHDADRATGDAMGAPPGSPVAATSSS